MLKILVLSLMCAIICAIPTVIGFGENSEKKRIGTGITLFMLDFMWMAVFLYVSCSAQTFLTMAIWIWPALILHFIVRGVQDAKNIEGYTIIILFAISLIMLIVSSIIKPVQNLIYVHDDKNIDVTYTISSDEILARLNVNIMDGTKLSQHYSVDSPEMRKIGGKDVAIYHIRDKNDGDTEYIPGYIIMEKNEKPKIISKRLYYDPSYYNGKDALRTVRREYPDIYIGEAKFDVDDEYNMYRVYEYRENFLYTDKEKDGVSANKKEKDISTEKKGYGLITINLHDGEVQKYPEGEILDWIDFKTTEPR